MRNMKTGVLGMCPPQNTVSINYTLFTHLIKPASGGSETQIEPIF